MKNIANILREAPKKQKIVISFLDGCFCEEKEITEEQFRYLQVCIAKGEYPYDKVSVKDNLRYIRFKPDGRLTESPTSTNCLSFNDNLAMELLYAKAGM